MKDTSSTRKITAVVALLLAVLMAVISGRSYWDQRHPAPGVDQVVPTPGFEKHLLSEYAPTLKGSPADTPVYIKEGAEAGGTVLILGGTHANEPSSTLAATVFLENMDVAKGRVIIIPFANPMGRTHTYPQEAHPGTFRVQRPDGSARIFRFGARTTNPIHDWPNPDIYVHPSSKQAIAGVERSNLNRAYPGRPDGSATEKLAYGILTLIKTEGVDLSFDLHEASPEYPVVDAIVAHENAMELAAMISMDLEAENIPMRLEPSPKNLHGLSHREWGDHSDTLAILMETANPSQGRFRGKTDEQLILDGRDKAYAKARDLNQIYIPYDTGAQTLSLRVARHVTAVKVAMGLLEFVKEDKGIEVSKVPEYRDMVEKGVGAFLADPV